MAGDRQHMNETREIELSRGLVALVDAEDFEWLSQWKWHASKMRCGTAYAMRGDPDNSGGLVIMHREILKPGLGLETDHVNGNGLDNRRENLRAVTHAQNMQNRRSQTSSSSRYKGVSWHRGCGKWRACGPVAPDTKKHLGLFDNEVEAALAHDRAILEAGSSFARLNFPDAVSRSYRENPKTAGSGIVCAIPQTGICGVGCVDCWFQSGRSYLEPLVDNVPNVPTPPQSNRIVRMNDGNDSNQDREVVERSANMFRNAFFNTSQPTRLAEFPGPVVLTVNPSEMTDDTAHTLKDPPVNLMFVRVRVNMWNLALVDQVVEHYAAHEVPTVLTFMAYYTETVPPEHAGSYEFRKRTLNSYWVIKQDAWDAVVARYTGNRWVSTCGKDASTHACRHCGVCLREFYATRERMRET